MFSYFFVKKWQLFSSKTRLDFKNNSLRKKNQAFSKRTYKLACVNFVYEKLWEVMTLICFCALSKATQSFLFQLQSFVLSAVFPLWYKWDALFPTPLQHQKSRVRVFNSVVHCSVWSSSLQAVRKWGDVFCVRFLEPFFCIKGRGQGI